MTPQTPYGWMIQGSTSVWFGEYAELDANAEAMRCGGTCTAFAIYIEPVAVPAKREPLSDGQIDAVTLAQWGEMNGYPLAAHRAYARAIEAKAQQVAVPDKHEPLSDDEIAEWFVSENGLEDSRMCIYLDFEAVIRAVEARLEIIPQGDKQ